MVWELLFPRRGSTRLASALRRSKSKSSDELGPRVAILRRGVVVFPFPIQSRKEVTVMKETIALLGTVAMLAYLFVQAMLLALQPLFAAFSNHPR